MLPIIRYELSLVVRRLFRRRAQTALMFATFAVSISLSLLSWSLFHAIFLRNPAFDAKGELCIVEQQPATVDWYFESTREQVEDWQQHQTVFSDFAVAVLYNSSFLTYPEGTERVLSANLSTAALAMMGAKPFLGRLFSVDEDKPGCAPVVILSETMWRERFSADPRVIGRVVKLDGVGATIVGVMPASFRFPNNQQIWLPLGFLNSLNVSDSSRNFDVVARLKPGISRQRAIDDLTLIQSRRPDTSGYRFKPTILPFRDYFLSRSVQLSAAVLFFLAVLFVLVSCSNAANLAMIDFLGRNVELATATALGVPRLATIRHLCLQIFLVAVAAAGVAVGLLALAAPHLHAALTQMNAPYWLEFSLEGHHAVMALGLAAFSTAVAVALPIGYLVLLHPDHIIRQGAGGSRGTSRGGGRRILLTAQIALLTLLAVSAAMLLRSSYRLAANPLGFNPAPVFIGKMGVRESDFPTAELRHAVFRRISDEVARVPGVAGATVADISPGYPLVPNCFYAADPAQLANGQSMGGARSFAVTEDFLNVLQIPVASGETFVRVEKQEGLAYALINQSLADRLWPNHDALGRALYVRFGASPDTPVTTLVVRGITQDFRSCGPTRQQNDSIMTPFERVKGLFGFLLVRGEHGVPDPKAIQDAVRRVDLRVALYFPDSLEHQIDLTVSPLRLTTRLTSLYAVAAALLCALGIYSITVSQVLQRSREFGIRMALGIDPERLWARYARGYLVTAAGGVVIGLAAAIPTVRALTTLMYGLSPYHTPTFVLVAAGILGIAAVACLPSRFRLQRIRPGDCLRSL
jgi:putative ABC transport system permease protein